MERDTVPQQPHRHRPGDGVSRFAAALDQAVASQDGPGRRWTEIPLGGGPLHPSLIGINTYTEQAASPRGPAPARTTYRS